ncbi:hypothetical protein CSHISOI_00082 [Colletotrichum shisoi]|uniref:Uncharacterized protein n=1 Tax=Colletotrichum shisoi TaxID=2078593 RepID=A0A5Q4C7L3_9PEZI|nr:hypothetical protein CSHISOI_00082 [Colletotrichum shisoi]
MQVPPTRQARPSPPIWYHLPNGYHICRGGLALHNRDVEVAQPQPPGEMLHSRPEAAARGAAPRWPTSTRHGMREKISPSRRPRALSQLHHPKDRDPLPRDTRSSVLAISKSYDTVRVLRLCPKY